MDARTHNPTDEHAQRAEASANRWMTLGVIIAAILVFGLVAATSFASLGAA